MQVSRKREFGIVTVSAFLAVTAFSHSAALGSSVFVLAGQFSNGLQDLIIRDLAADAHLEVVPVTDLPPEPGVRYYRRRPSFREYTFRGRRFGGSRYKGPPTPFYQIYNNNRTANGFDYGGRCTRVSAMCVRNAENTRAGYNSCMQAYGCRQD